MRKADTLAHQASTRKPKAAKLLARVATRATRVAAAGRISDTCEATLALTLQNMQDELMALHPTP